MTDLVSFNFYEIQNVTFGMSELMSMQNTVCSLESVQDRALKLSVLQENITGMGFSGCMRNLQFFFKLLDNFHKVLKGEEYYTLNFQNFKASFSRTNPQHHYSGSPPVQHTDDIFLILPKSEPKRIENYNIIHESTLEIQNFFSEKIFCLLWFCTQSRNTSFIFLSKHRH